MKYFLLSLGLLFSVTSVSFAAEFRAIDSADSDNPILQNLLGSSDDFTLLLGAPEANGSVTVGQLKLHIKQLVAAGEIIGEQKAGRQTAEKVRKAELEANRAGRLALALEFDPNFKYNASTPSQKASECICNIINNIRFQAREEGFNLALSTVRESNTQQDLEDEKVAILNVFNTKYSGWHIVGAGTVGVAGALIASRYGYVPGLKL